MPRRPSAGAAHRRGSSRRRAGGGRGGRRFPAGRDAATSRNPSANRTDRGGARARRRRRDPGVQRAADSGLEHYRGAYHNPAMYLAPSAAAVSLVNSVHMILKPEVSSTGRLALSGLTLSTGLTGLAFHLANVAKRDGGVNLLNLFYGAPLLAPGAIAISGLAGLAAARLVAEAEHGSPPTLLGRPAGTMRRNRRRLFDAVHDGGGGAAAFPRRVSRPVHVRPGDSAAGRRRWCWPSPPSCRALRKAARLLLRLTAAAGVAGVGFHTYGVQPQHGRVLQLEPEPPERAADTGAAFLHRRRAGRAGGGPADGGRIGGRMSQGFRNRYPTYNVLDKWDTPSWNEQTRAVVAKRLHEIPRRGGSSARPNGNPGAGDLRSADPAAGPAGRSGADRPVHRREAAREPGQRLSLRGACRQCARPGGSACSAIDEEARARWQRGFRELPDNQKDAVLRSVQHGDTLSDAWQGMPPKRFFSSVLLREVVDRLLRAPGGMERDRLRRPGLAARLCPAAGEPARSVGGDGGSSNER